MFDNLLYIFSKDTVNFVETDNNNYYVREVDKLNKALLQKNSELQLLQRKYNKLLNHCIENELASKLNNKKRIESIIIQDIQDSNKVQDVKEVSPYVESSKYLRDAIENVIYIPENNKYVSDNEEYEKI